jgi:PucR C-terminal helix-turn-helix domain/GGDEF-like domain
MTTRIAVAGGAGASASGGGPAAGGSVEPSSVDHSQATLGRILHDLGATLLELVLGESRLSSLVESVAIHDLHDDSPLPPNSIVLGVGVHESDELAGLLRRLGDAGAVGLIVRTPLTIDDEVRLASATSRVALLALARGASWTQVAALLRTILAEGDVGRIGANDRLMGMPAGDLFSIANAVSALVDAPITIEDLNSCLLAFSGGQDDADVLRSGTILGRRCPESYRQLLEERGVFGALYRSERPISVDLPDVLPRVAVAVRAGDEVLGAMWALAPELTQPREQAFVDSAAVVALHMLRQRAGADVDRRLRTDLVATVLEGGSGAHDALRRLEIASGPAVVLALGIPKDDVVAPVARAEADRQRVADAFALHLAAVHPRSASALLGGVVYGILPVPHGRDDADDSAVRIAQEFLKRTGDRIRYVVGVGRIAHNVAEIAQSRLDADRALRVLRSGRATNRIVRISDVYAGALLLELSDMVADDTTLPDGPIRRLIEYDAEHHAQLVPSLRAWLDAFGDVNAAAAAVHVHPSTFRYRLKRLTEVSGLNLDNADQRFAAMLQLRLLRE